MSGIRREDLISEDALQAPYSLAKGFEEVLNVVNKLIASSKQGSQNIAMADSLQKINEQTQILTKSQADLEKVQSKVADNSRQRSREELASLDQLIKKREVLKQKIKDAATDQKEDLDLLKHSVITRDEYNKRVEESNIMLEKTKERLSEQNDLIKTHLKLEGQDAQAITRKTSSLRQLEVALAKNRQEYAKLSNEEQRNSKEGKALLAVIQQQDKDVKELSKSVGVNNKEVGNYTESIKKAIGPLEAMVANLTGVRISSVAASAGLQSGAKGANLFAIALKSIPIIAIISALGSLLAYFKGTEEGAQRFRIVMASLKQIFDSLKDVVIDFGKALFNALYDPKQLIIDIGNAIKDNFIRQFYGAIELVVALKDAGVAAFKILKEYVTGGWMTVDGDKRIKEAKKDLAEAGEAGANAMVKAATGVDNYRKKLEDAKKSFGDFVDKTNEKVKEAVRLQELENQLIVARRNFLVEEQRLTRDINEQREIAADTLLVEEERLEAAIKSRELMDELEKKRLGLARTELYIAQERAKLSYTDETTLEHIKQLEADILAIESQRYQQGIRITRQIGTLQTQILEREKALALSRLSEREKDARREADAMVQGMKLAVDAEIALVKHAVLTNSITRRQGNRELRNINREAALNMIESNINATSAMIKNSYEFEAERVAIIEKSGLRQAEIEKEVTKVQQEAIDERIALEKKLHDLRMQFQDTQYNANVNFYEDTIETLGLILEQYQVWAQSLSALFNNLADSKIASIDRQIEASEKQADRELELAGNNERAKADIEGQAEIRREQLERKKIAAQRKAAIFDKATAVINAGIQGAMAVLVQLGGGDPYTAFARAAAAGALAAVQIASILAKQIPQYEHGGITESPLIIAGEKGAELYKTPKGEFGLTPGVPTLMRLPVGTEITPHNETVRMLAMSSLGQETFVQRGNTELIKEVKALRKSNDAVVSAIYRSRPDLVRQGSLIYDAVEDNKGNKNLVRKRVLG